MQSLPLDAAAITPSWLTAALSARYPGVRVASVEVLHERGSTNHHVRLGVAYDEPAGLPATMFAKMASLDEAHRIAIGSTGMGTREARFYDELASSINMRIPTSYFAGSGDDGAFLILLEDLAATGAAMSDGTWGIPADLAAGALSDLAQLHVRFEDAGRLEAVRPWVTATPAMSSDFTRPMLQMVIDQHADVLSPAYIAVAKMYIADPDAIIALWGQGPQTLIHGDTHIGNLFIDDGRVGFLDWGLLNISTPMRDVSYFLTMSMLADERRKHEGDLLQHYLDTRRSLGGSEISVDDAWQAHRVHTGYTVLASFLSLVPPYNGEDQREFSDAFRNRAITALDDLETVPALEKLLA
jgi:Phosphotransferase enzyme family